MYRRIIFRSTLIPKFMYEYHASLQAPHVINTTRKFLNELDNNSKSKADEIFEKHHVEYIKDSLVIYTDGSKLDKGFYVGASCYSS